MKYKNWKAAEHARDVSEVHNVKVENAWLAGFEFAIAHASGLAKTVVKGVPGEQLSTLINGVATVEVNEKGQRVDR